MPQTPEIRPFRRDDAQDAEAFWSLNVAWITTEFALEDEDRKVLGDPQGVILDQGGDILLAVVGERRLGCVALMWHGDDTLEVAKMTVEASQRGTGLGRRILQAALDRAAQMGARRVYLESGRKLTPAIQLYLSLGFRELGETEGEPSPYARCDIRMMLELDGARP